VELLVEIPEMLAAEVVLPPTLEEAATEKPEMLPVMEDVALLLVGTPAEESGGPPANHSDETEKRTSTSRFGP
jgi:hypothetical protein